MTDRCLECFDGRRWYRANLHGAVVQVEVSEDRRQWASLPMRRTLRSVLRSRHADWPPVQVRELRIASGQLEMEFEDIYVIWERPIFASWRESRWRAAFRDGRWEVTRVRYLSTPRSIGRTLRGFGGARPSNDRRMGIHGRWRLHRDLAPCPGRRGLPECEPQQFPADERRATVTRGHLALVVSELTTEWRHLPAGLSASTCFVLRVSDTTMDALRAQASLLAGGITPEDDAEERPDLLGELKALLVDGPWALVYLEEWEDMQVIRRATPDEAIEYLRAEVLREHPARGFLFFGEGAAR